MSDQTSNQAVTSHRIKVGGSADSLYDVTFPLVTLPLDGLEHRLNKARVGGKNEMIEQNKLSFKDVIRYNISTTAAAIILLVFGLRSLLGSENDEGAIYLGVIYLVGSAALVIIIVLDTLWRLRQNGLDELGATVPEIMSEFRGSESHHAGE